MQFLLPSIVLTEWWGCFSWLAPTVEAGEEKRSIPARALHLLRRNDDFDDLDNHEDDP